MTTWNNALNDRDPIYQLYNFKKNDGSSEFLAVSNLQLHKDVSGDLTPIIGTLETNFTKMITYKDRSINDVVLIADGGELKQYDGTSVTTVTPHTPTGGETTDPGLNDLANLTTFRTFALKKDRIFAAAHPTVKNRVHFSFFDPVLGYAMYDYFPTIYFFDVAVEDNDEITELRVFRNTLVIFCKKSVWVLKGDGASLTDFELIKVNAPNGCIAPNSVQEVGNNLFFLSDDHVYSLFATELEYISAQIMSDKVLPVLQSVGISDKALASSAFMNNKYYLSFPSGLTLVYDITLEAWTRYTNIQANYYLAKDNILYFSTNIGNVHKFNDTIYLDNGDAISFKMKTKIIDFDYPVHRKEFRKVWIISRQYDNFFNSFDLEVIVNQTQVQDLIGVPLVDFGDSGVWDQTNWDESTWDFRETQQNEFKVRKKGKDIQFQLSNAVANEPFSLYTIVVEYKIKKA